MSSDPWRHWQSLWAPFGAGGTPFPFAGSPPPGPASAAPAFAPFMDASERFAAALKDFLSGSIPRSQPGVPPNAPAAAEQFNNFLRDQFASHFRPPGTSSPGGTAPAAAPSPGPALGPGREQILRAERTFDAWSRLTQAQGRMQRMWSDTLRSAAAAFTSRLQAASGTTPTPEAIDRLYDQWIECAEQAYATTAHSEEFSDALSAQVNAAADWRRESAAGLEEWSKFWDLPTRSEINSLTRRLRELEAQLAAARAREAPAGGAKPAPTPRPKGAAKRPAARKRKRSASKRAR